MTNPIARHRRLFALLFVTVCFLAWLQPANADGPAGSPDGHDAGWGLLADPQNGFDFLLLHGPTVVGRVGIAGWGPSWAWVGVSGKPAGTGAASGGDAGVKGDYQASGPFVVNKAAAQAIDVKLHVTRPDPRSLTFRYDLTTDKDVPLTILCPTLGMDSGVAGQFVVNSDGKEATATLPLNRGAYKVVDKATFRLKEGKNGKDGDIHLRIDPPIDLGIDKDVRFLLAQDKFPAGSKSVSITLTFPADVALLAGASDLDRFSDRVAGPDWWPFQPASDASTSGEGDVIGMANWLDKPAGSHGGVRVAGDGFQFEDGTPVKFWGTNLSYGGNCAPEKKIADFTAARFARYGVNAVRLHKFSYPKNDNGIGDLNDSTQFDPAGLDRLDYFASQLKKNGVYFGWSHTYGFHVRPGDRDKLLAYDEIRKAYPDGNTYAFINFAPDVQDLLIQMVVNLLKHKNPHTGLTYAEEPALCFLEMQNEDDIFFYTSETAFKACPTYRKLFMERFADWLKAKYGSDEALAKAWGGVKEPEGLSARNLVPQVNPWFFSEDHLPKTTGGERQRLLDTAAFLHAAQNEFYGKYLKAVRAAGYKGPVIGSPWQAPAMLPHYYNLRSDYLAGYIDRHNYFGEHLHDTMLSRPGSGYLSSGLQQVVDRPFGQSEWITVYPSLYSAEGPPLIAAYGMGLQGWDASYEFQSQAQVKAFDNTAGTLPWGVWEADTPTQIGQYPALARMIYRGDVKQGPLISVRRVSPGQLADGKFDFTDKVSQQGDVKNFAGGSVPPAALAAGRVGVEFTDLPQPSSFPDMAKYEHGDAITSATGQLTWDYSGPAGGRSAEGGSAPGHGFFTINTPGTKAVVGFAAGREQTLGDVHITSDNPYASIVLTAVDKGSTLATAKTALLTAVARSCNTGFRYFTPGNRVLENGHGPILMEPVKAMIATGREVAAVNVLDAEGRRTGQTLSAQGGIFSIDGARDKTMYYEVVFR